MNNKIKNIGLAVILGSVIWLGVVFQKQASPVVSGDGPIVGGLTRTAIGAQVKWTTDLIPSNSYTVNLGSSALPVNNYFGKNASLSINFEVLGYASASGNLFVKGASSSFSAGSINVNNGLHATGNVTTLAQFMSTGTGSNSFAGSLALSKGLTGTVGVFSGTGSNSFSGSLNLGKSLTGINFTFTGTASSSLAGGLVVTKQLYANGGLIFKTSTSTTATLTTAGQSLINTGSSSFDFYDGTNQIVIGPRCFTYIPSPLTSINQQIGKRFNDPFTIISISPVASPSGNSVGWNLYKGAPGSVTTAVFTNNKSASTSAYPKYTTFANATLADGDELDPKITSASNKITQFSVTICGRYNK